MSIELGINGHQVYLQPILTFHGNDGCGKTTLATDLYEHGMSTKDDALLIGSSDCEKWLNESIYARYIGSPERLERGTASDARARDQVNFYEDVAICLYGVAQQHAMSRGPVVIHSDPFLKRLTWAREHFGDDGFWEYSDRFNEYITSRIGDIFSSHVVIVEVDEKVSFRRAKQRGGVKGFDPETEDDNRRMAEAVRFVGTSLLGAQRPYERLLRTKVHAVSNLTVSIEAQEDLFKTTRESIHAFMA